MKGKLRLAAIAVLALVFVVSLTRVVLRMLDYQGGEADHNEAEALVELPELDMDMASLSELEIDWAPVPSQAQPETPAPSPEGAGTPSQGPAPSPEPAPSAQPKPKLTQAEYEQALKGLDLSALREVNGQVVGWITIPGTRISYPLVQGTDNQYYLNHTWKGVQRSVGSIFMEWRCSPDMSGFNTIIYGHRMSDSSMFHTLLSYDRESFYQAHPLVYIAGDGICRRYRIFSAYEASVTGPTYTLGFRKDEDRQEFINYCLTQSAIYTGVAPAVDSQIVTLSTCTSAGSSDTRWVVHAVLEAVI